MSRFIEVSVSYLYRQIQTATRKSTRQLSGSLPFELAGDPVRGLAILRLFQEMPMTVRTEKNGAIWTVVHSRFDVARNAMDPESADQLVEQLQA